MRKAVLIVAILFFSVETRAQSVEGIENRMYRYATSIAEIAAKNDYDYYDSLMTENKNLLDYLEVTLVKSKATLKYDFKKLENTWLHILSSDDKKFRIYFWYVGGGGSAKSFNGILQYEAPGGSKVRVLNDVSKEKEVEVCSGSPYSNLYTIHTVDNKIVYLTVENTIIWNGAGGKTIKAYTIRNGKLNDSIKFFKTADQELNSIFFYYDLTANVNRKNGIEEIPDFKISEDKQLLYVPLIKNNDEITSQNLIYRFDGKRFVFD